MQIKIYDTSLRDGAQCKDVNFTVQDKIKIALELDKFGVDYIEAGMPASNENEALFFTEIQNYKLKKARLVAFANTHHANTDVSKDKNIQALIQSKAEVFGLVGKASALHVKEDLNISLEKNLQIIQSSIAYAKKFCSELIFDAEHFFDGYKENPEYSLKVLKTAQEAGANYLVLCDTNGGLISEELYKICKTVRKTMPKANLGVHCHNDCELAVSNTLRAVDAKFNMLHGTINGIGERCGNANLCSIMPILAYKYKNINFKAKKNLHKLTLLSAFVSEVANMSPFSRQPFVGSSAFAHKGGIHASAVNKNSSSYEHIDPELLGNSRNIIISELSGRANIISLAKNIGFSLDKDDPIVIELSNELKIKSMHGYDYSAAKASAELLLLNKLGQSIPEFFKLIRYSITDSKYKEDGENLSEASVILEVNGVQKHTAALGAGPVNALDIALRKALEVFYPKIMSMKLIDFKVRAFSRKGVKLQKDDGYDGTASVVRVLIESGDKNKTWTTVGVSYDVIDASWQALVDSVNYKLYLDNV